MTRVVSGLRRIPIRLRLTLAFTVVMALLLAGSGVFLRARVGDALMDTVDHGLESRAGDIGTLLSQDDSALSDPGSSPLESEGETLAQVLDRRGRIVVATEAVRSTPLLTRPQAAVALRHTLVFDALRPGDEPDRLRVLATPTRSDGRRVIVVVATMLEPTDEALHTLRNQLLIGIPLLLLVAAIVGYGVAAAALRPVELMRRRADTIEGGGRGERLPVGPGDDEIARLGSTLNAMLVRLEQAFVREQRFVADASHELRTPLAILKTELELALRQAKTVDEYHDATVSAAQETDRLVQLAEDLLVIARSGDGGLPVKLERLSAAELLAATAERFARRAQEGGVVIEVEAPDGLRFWGDRLRLEQALGNLVDNALRYARSPIRLSARAPAGHVELAVCDAGPGFPRDFLPTAFDRFSRADTARGRGGSGLGLAITAAIAEAHGGVARAENTTQGGARVVLELPAEA